jgi:elongation factor P
MADNSALLRNGNKILIDNEPYLILDNSFVNPGKGQAFTKVRIRNLLNNKVLEKTIKIGETILEADVMNTKMQFLYKENEVYFFMHLSTYE